MLFIDHPVGTGFSYVTNSSLYAKTDREMGRFMKLYFMKEQVYQNKGLIFVHLQLWILLKQLKYF